MYYAQVQGQLLILDMDSCYIFIWTPLLNTNVANTLLVRAQCDADFISEMVNPLGGNPTNWSNTLKQFVGKVPMNCLIVFGHFVKLALK